MVGFSYKGIVYGPRWWGLAIKELCMVRDGGKLENFDYHDCIFSLNLNTMVQLLFVVNSYCLYVF